MLDWQKNPIATYLMACYAYEVLSDPILSDEQFDALGIYLYSFGDLHEHRHKEFIDFEACHYTSALTVPYHELPTIVLTATHQLLGTRFEKSPIYKANCLYRESKYGKLDNEALGDLW